MDQIQLIDINAENVLEYGVCGYKNIKRPGYPEKLSWLADRFSEGLKIKSIVSEKAGTQGMIEYISGEYCWRPINAKGYMVIHCIFCGFKSAYKGKGYGTQLLNECLHDAQVQKQQGVAVVTRKGSFMADKDVFLKAGFQVVDKAPPDFELLVSKFSKTNREVSFRSGWNAKVKSYGPGLTIIRADQCPYTVRNVQEICETARADYGIEPTVITLRSAEEAQNSPSAFGTFCMIYNGTVIAYHPTSKGRFINIMNKISR